MQHQCTIKKTGSILLLGHTAEYEKGTAHPTGRRRMTFYSIFDKDKKEFRRMEFLGMPQGFENCGNGSGQSIELDNGDLLIPVYYKTKTRKTCIQR